MSGHSSPLPPPRPNQPFFHVSALDAGTLDIATYEIIADAKEDEVVHVPSLAFYLRHSETGKELLFDLGIRKSCEKGPETVKVPQTSGESLRRGGVDPESIETIVISHLHWDHVGSAAEYPKAMFIVGPGCGHLVKDEAAPEVSVIAESVPPSRTRILDASNDFHTSIGPFPQAHDFFNDGSLYIIDAAGHFAGHINVLVRTSADGSWIYLAGDTAHDLRVLRGEKEMTHRYTDDGCFIGMHDHKEIALEHIARVRSLLSIPKVHVLIAHDSGWYEKNRGGEAFLPGTIPPKLD